MDRKWWAKLSLLVFFVFMSVVYVFPTVSNLDLAKTSFPFKKKVNLGLDLQGGLYMVFGIELKKIYVEIINRQLESFKTSLVSEVKTLHWKSIEDQALLETDPRAEIVFDNSQREMVYRALKDTYTSLRIVEESPGRIAVGLSRSYRDEIQGNILNQSIEVIRNRIDEFGVTEPGISSKGEDRIVVELPGVREIERAKQLVGRTAKLEFKIVNDRAMTSEQLFGLIAQIEESNKITFKEGDRFSDYVSGLNRLAKGKIPTDSEIAFERPEPRQQQGNRGERAQWIPYLLFSKVDVTGADLRDAQVAFDQETRSPIVTFELNPKGAATFETLTGAHQGERLAIVLDNIVHSAPVIQTKIGGGRGQITLGRGQDESHMKEAKDLAIVLRAGALPAQLDLLEQRVIGPTLGRDSIKNGVIAGVVGCLLIFGFMTFYYRMSGVVAVLSLTLNGLFAFAILIGIEATLTLPGIAGLALVIGMAVDSNVIIFERIRDELDEGKLPAQAIESGFDKAFSSIFDANITHGIVGVILLNFGSGPIKGFAVSLLIGILTTLFTAVTVCKLIFDGYVSRKAGKIARLSI